MHVEYIDSFNYFTSLHPTISNGTVLDYGSNSGNFLTSAGLNFPHEKYVGIDVDESAINLGQRIFPTAEFIHYNTFNHMYNPNGVLNIPLPVTGPFDTIISYSVFTHTTQEDMVSRIDDLYRLLTPGGKLMFTYLNIESNTTVDYFRKKRIKDFGYCNYIDTRTMLYLVDADVRQTPENSKMLVTFYHTDYLLSLLSKYQPTAQICPTNCNNCIQDCIIISK